MLRPVDRVVVQKSNRRMELYREGALVASYKISLGLQPVGQKQREGDYRTPEGRYRLTRRNAQSDFFLAVQVSYPEAADVAMARRNGWAPGGAIMVHGLPNIPEVLARSLPHHRLDRRLHRAVEREHARLLAADGTGARRSRSARERRRRARPFGSRARARLAEGGTRQPLAAGSRQAPRPRPGRPVPAVPPLCARRAELRHADRRRAPDLRGLQGLRAAHRARALGHQARDAACARQRLRRRRDDPGRQGAPVRGAARHRVHAQRDRRALRPRRPRERHQRDLLHPAQRARARVQGTARPRGVLGRPLDPARGIRLHQAGRLRARPARALGLHRLRPRRDEGADEGRDDRPFQAAHQGRPLHRHHRARASSRPSRPTRSSISS